MAGTFNFDSRETGIDRGATWYRGLGIDTGLDERHPVPVAPSGAADIILTIKWRGGSIVKTKASGQITINDAHHTIFFDLDKDETLRIPAGRLTSYEIEARFADGTQMTLVAGMITAFGGLTNG